VPTIMGSGIHSKAGSSMSHWLPVWVGTDEASCIVIDKKHGLPLHLSYSRAAFRVAASWRKLHQNFASTKT
jgi:hypothetical protein